MADERLRLVAEVQDQFTGPLDKLNAKLQRTAAAGMTAAKDMKKDFEGFHGVIGKAVTTMDGMVGGLRAMGGVSLGAGLGLAGVATAVAGFAKSTQQLKIMSTETGLAVNELRAFGNLGARFGVSADTMQAGVKRFSDEMSQLRRRFGEAYTGLEAMKLGDLVEKLVAAPNMKAALDAAMDALSNIGDPVKRRKVAEMLFGSDQIAAVAGQVSGRYREMMDEILRMQGTLDDKTSKAADEFAKNLSRMGEAAERLKLNTIGPVLKGLNEIVIAGDRAGIRGNAEAMEGSLQERLAKTTAKRDFLASEAGGGVEKNADRLKTLEREIARLTDELKRTKENPAGPSSVSAIPMSFSGGTGVGALIQRASFGGGGYGGGMGAPSLGGFGGALPTLGGGYGFRGGGGAPKSATGVAPVGGAPIVPGVPAARGGVPTGSDAGNLTALIDRVSREERVDASWLNGIRAGESGHRHNRGNPRSAYDHNPGTPGRPEDSWGPFQLNRHRGLGVQFQKETGLDLSDPRTIPDQVRWVARYLRKQFDRNPNYSPFPTWQGFHGRRAASPTWGASGYVPTGPAVAAANENQNFPNGAPRALKPRSMAGDANVPGQVAEPRGGIASIAGSRSGDAMMRRLYGEQAPVAKGGKGTLHIQFDNAPPGMRPRASMDDLFKEVNISKSRQMETTSI